MSEQHSSCAPVPLPTNPNFKNLTGKRFGRWLVLSISPRRGYRNCVMWVCQCDCGTVKDVIAAALQSGISASCGCYKNERSADRLRSHGLWKSPSYVVWTGMIARCYKPATNGFHNYGGRGIKVCDRWLNSLEAFIEDMGPRPSRKHSIDRIDNDGNYEPGNCRWATEKEQILNKRTTRAVTHNGKTQSLRAWAIELGVGLGAANQRVRRGWRPLQALGIEPPPELSPASAAVVKAWVTRRRKALA